MRDGPGRRAVKAVALLAYRFDLAVFRAVERLRGETAYRLAGACQSCAACCEEPAIQVGRVVWFSRTARTLFLAWHRRVNGFELSRRDRAARTFYFRCTHFDPQTRRCDSYESRPGMCRDYPRALLHQPNPELFPGCGYRVVAGNAERLSAALDRQLMSDEQRRAIKRRLRVLP